MTAHTRAVPGRKRSKLIASVRSATKRAVDTWTPQIGRAYRTIRAYRTQSAKPLVTPWGFNLIGSTSMASGRYEAEETGVFLKYLAESSVCVDIGANIGLYSCLAASRSRHVVAIEPLCMNVALLCRNLLNNGFYGVEVYPVGLSDKPGIKELYGIGTAASLVPGWAETPTNWKRQVPISTLDILLGQRFADRHLLIKMDVEGSEYDVLRGAQQILASSPKPIWLVEIALEEHYPGTPNPHFLDTFELFWSSGYQAAVADETAWPVNRESVFRWLNNGTVDFGSHNYVFSAVAN